MDIELNAPSPQNVWSFALWLDYPVEIPLCHGVSLNTMPHSHMGTYCFICLKKGLYLMALWEKEFVHGQGKGKEGDTFFSAEAVL